jgi:DNA-binding MarR family transcriptional regulator
MLLSELSTGAMWSGLVWLVISGAPRSDIVAYTTNLVIYTIVVNTTIMEDMTSIPKTRTTQELLQPSGWLLRASSDMAHAIDTGAVAETGLDSTTLDLLLRLRLAPEGHLRGVDLCSQLHKSPSHMSRVVDRAEALGLVRRTPDPTDRRAHLIAATKEGAAATDSYLPLLEAVLQNIIFATLTADEIDTLTELLTRISEAANSASRQLRP